jgi:hypothetical protein
MRFREFFKIDEAIPAVTAKDLRSMGPATLKATQNLAGQVKDKIAAAVGQKAPDPAAKNATVPPGIQAQANVQPSAIQQAQAQQANNIKKPPVIPAIGSQLVLPDRDTKKPSSFTIGSIKGDDITLKPVKSTPNDPKVDVTVKKKDLSNALTALNPDDPTSAAPANKSPLAPKQGLR